jgi:4-hydroxymandelate oxidase
MGAEDRLPVNVAEYEARARARMDPASFDYYAGGAGDERTLSENVLAWRRWNLRPRVLAGVGAVSTATDVLGSRLAFPVIVAPTALHRLACDDGECATARACSAVGTVHVVSTVASRTLEDIAASADGPRWLQLYVPREREHTRALIRRAEACGVSAFVLTVDTPRLGRRERDLRNDFQLPAGVEPVHFPPLDPAAGDPALGHFARYANLNLDPALDWSIVAWLRAETRLPLVLKGVLTAEDARLAAEHGVDAVVVSNHGGRQLDGVVPTAVALPEVVAAASDRMAVLVDGGIRRGVDVLVALALGATAVMVGRPVLWGLAADGEQGARRVLELLRDEIEHAMALSGKRSIAEIGLDLVQPARV